MPVNKVVYGDKTLIDITDTTAAPESVIQGQIFYDKSGARATGTLGLVTQTTDGLMAAVDKAKLDGINIECKTTTEWNATPSYIPPQGAIMIYSDHKMTIRDGVEIAVPDIKIGDGKAYGIDLPFVNDTVGSQLLFEINAHINDPVSHVTAAERRFWNNKINYEVVDEQLVLNHD